MQLLTQIRRAIWTPRRRDRNHHGAMRTNLGRRRGRFIAGSAEPVDLLDNDEDRERDDDKADYIIDEQPVMAFCASASEA